MEKIYRVQMNANGMPNFSTAVEVADKPQGEWIAKDGVFYCSRCDNDSGLSEEDVDLYEMSLPNYCQDCGAKMKGAEYE